LLKTYDDHQLIPLVANAQMSVRTLKDLIEDQLGISFDNYCLLLGCKQLIDGTILSDYNIQSTNRIYLLRRLLGGIYHFTSGQQDFSMLPYGSAEAITNIFQFQLKNNINANQLSLSELQNFILQAQTVLSNLYQISKDTSVAENIQHLNDIILPIGDDSENH